MLQVTKKAPEFEMRSVRELKTAKDIVGLSDYKGKWLIMLFYPLDFTTVCHGEIKAFSDNYEKIKKAGAEVLAVSTDSVHSHRAWLTAREEDGGLGPIKFPLASDITKDVSRDYGILLEEEGIPLFSLFIIDPDGVLQYQVVHALDIGHSVDEALRMLEALKSEWKPGQKALHWTESR